MIKMIKTLNSKNRRDQRTSRTIIDHFLTRRTTIIFYSLNCFEKNLDRKNKQMGVLPAVML